MRFFRKIFKSNWKYILTELVLIFVGIYLALSLNNWNENKKIAREKASVIRNLEEEINKNLETLREAEEQNVLFFRAFERYGRLSGNDDREIEATEEELDEFKADFPDFFRVDKKEALGGGRFRYGLSLNIVYSGTGLRDIAWSTAKTAGFSREFSYACMLSIEDVYRSQDKYLVEIGKILPFVIDNEYSRIPVTAILLRQYQASLQSSYAELLEELKTCK